MNKMSTLVIKGVKKVFIAKIKFIDEYQFNYSTIELKKATRDIANFYNTTSRNIVQIVPEVQMILVPFSGTLINQVGPYIKNRFLDNDIYIIMSKFVDNDHTTNEFTYVKNITDINRNFARSLGLDYAGAYIYNGKGYTYDQSGDGSSIISKYSGTYLTSPAYFYLGWTLSSEIITIDNITKLPATFRLKRIINLSESGISTLIFKNTILKNSNGRDAFISFPQPTKYFGNKPFVALHLKTGSFGGSTKIKTFKNGFYDSIFTHLNIKVENTSTTNQLVITVSLTPPTIAYPIELVPIHDCG